MWPRSPNPLILRDEGRQRVGPIPLTLTTPDWHTLGWRKGFRTMTFPRSTQLPGSILPGQGPDLDKVFYDTFSEFRAGAASRYILTDTGGGTAIIMEDGWALVTEGDDNDSVEVQVTAVAAGGAFALEDNRDIYGYARMKIDDVDLTDWFFGLCNLDTAFIDGTVDAVGLCSSTGSAIADSASASVFAVRGSAMGASWGNATFVDTGVDLLDGRVFTVAFWVEGRKRIRFYVNGKETVNVTTGDFPASGVRMTPTFGLQAQSGAARTLTMQSVYIAQTVED